MTICCSCGHRSTRDWRWSHGLYNVGQTNPQHICGACRTRPPCCDPGCGVTNDTVVCASSVTFLTSNTVFLLNITASKHDTVCSLDTLGLGWLGNCHTCAKKKVPPQKTHITFKASDIDRLRTRLNKQLRLQNTCLQFAPEGLVQSGVALGLHWRAVEEIDLVATVSVSCSAASRHELQGVVPVLH